jgi:hypothetical protein
MEGLTRDQALGALRDAYEGVIALVCSRSTPSMSAGRRASRRGGG